jgi:hypothetical protein
MNSTRRPPCQVEGLSQRLPRARFLIIILRTDISSLEIAKSREEVFLTAVDPRTYATSVNTLGGGNLQCRVFRDVIDGFVRDFLGEGHTHDGEGRDQKDVFVRA